jgi:hypothetical protein
MWMFDAYETNHDGDGETFLMSPFEIAIERHVDWTPRAHTCWEEGW